MNQAKDRQIKLRSRLMMRNERQSVYKSIA